MGLDHWAIARCVSVSEGTVRRAGNAYHLPVSIKFQLISPCWYSTVLHGVEANKWADAPTEFDEFTLDGGGGRGRRFRGRDQWRINPLHRCDYQRYGGGWALQRPSRYRQCLPDYMDGYAGREQTLIINCGAKAYSTTTTQPTVDCHSVLSIILTNGSSWNQAPIPSQLRPRQTEPIRL